MKLKTVAKGKKLQLKQSYILCLFEVLWQV